MDSVEEGNKVMLTLYDHILEIQDRAKSQIFEIGNYYRKAGMGIFNDDSIEELASATVVIHQFKVSFEGDKDDIGWAKGTPGHCDKEELKHYNTSHHDLPI